MIQQSFRVMILGQQVLDPNFQSSHDGLLKKFIAQSDLSIASLDPFQLPREDRLTNLGILRELGVSTVNLAAASLSTTSAGDIGSVLAWLSDAKIASFGFGSTQEEARRPHRVELPSAVGGGALEFHAQCRRAETGQQVQSASRANNSESLLAVPEAIAPPLSLGGSGSEVFRIALPSWGPLKGWRTFAQYRDAYRLLRNSHNLVLGQGTESIQEIERQHQRWVVYGLGDLWLGKLDAQEAPGTLWPVLEVVVDAGGQRTLSLKLYPVPHAASGATHGGPVVEEVLQSIIRSQSEQATTAWRFNNVAQSTGEDALGPHLRLDLGEWSIGQAPSLLTPLSDKGDPGIWTPQRTPVETENNFLDLKKISMGASMLALQAEKSGGTADWISSRQALITYGKKKFVAYGYVSYESALGVSICADKVLTAQFLMKSGVQTPATRLVSTEDEAAEVAKQWAGPVVVKPSDGKKSQGVTTNLTGDVAVREAFRVASQHGSQVVVQQHIDAEEEIRVMAASQGAFAVLRRVLPHVIGDGMSTIKQLIEDKNLQRELNPSMRSRSIPMDSATETQLSRLGLTLESIPSLGEHVVVRNVAGLSAGADPYQAFEDTNDNIKELAANAVSAIPGLGWGGVDVILERGTGEPYVLEINTDAGYGQAMFPTYGKPRDVAATAWNLRIAQAEPTPTSTPKAPRHQRSPRPLLQELSPSGKTYSRAHLQTITWSFLRRSGYRITKLSPAIFEVKSPKASALLTKALMTVQDRSASVRILRRHGLVRELLKLAGVPRVDANFVATREQLQSHRESFLSNVVILPTSSPWGGRESRKLATQKVNIKRFKRTRLIIQEQPEGQKYRVLASNKKAIAVATQSPQRSDKKLTRTASSLAVRAVRAVPELRWSCVDIIISPARGGLVEGMTLNPRFESSDVVVGGSVEDFYKYLVNG